MLLSTRDTGWLCNPKARSFKTTYQANILLLLFAIFIRIIMESPLSALSMENLGTMADTPPLFTELLELYRYEDGYQVRRKGK